MPDICPQPTGVMRPLVIPGRGFALCAGYGPVTPPVWNRPALVEDPCPYANGDPWGMSVMEGNTLARADATGIEIQVPEGGYEIGGGGYIRIKNTGGHRRVTGTLSYDGFGEVPYARAHMSIVVRKWSPSAGQYLWDWISGPADTGVQNLSQGTPEVDLGVWHRYAIEIFLTGLGDQTEPPYFPAGTVRVDFTYA